MHRQSSGIIDPLEVTRDIGCSTDIEVDTLGRISPADVMAVSVASRVGFGHFAMIIPGAGVATLAPDGTPVHVSVLPPHVRELTVRHLLGIPMSSSESRPSDSGFHEATGISTIGYQTGHGESGYTIEGSADAFRPDAPVLTGLTESGTKSHERSGGLPSELLSSTRKGSASVIAASGFGRPAGAWAQRDGAVLPPREQMQAELHLLDDPVPRPASLPVSQGGTGTKSDTGTGTGAKSKSQPLDGAGVQRQHV